MTESVDEAVKGADFLYTDVWLSMGEDEAAWAKRIERLTPYRVTREVMAATGNPYAKFMHCLPAFHNADTEVGADIAKRFGIDCMEVTDEVFESAGLDRVRPGGEPHAHHQGDPRRHDRRLTPCASL